MKLPQLLAQVRACDPGDAAVRLFAIRREGSYPIHRTDVGALLMADLIGARSMIYVKDERGLFTEIPRRTRMPSSFLRSDRVRSAKLDVISNGRAWRSSAIEVIDHVQIVTA